MKGSNPGLPPQTPSDKVTKRHKKSTKRPTSCEMNENKKENRFNFKSRIISPNQLHEDDMEGISIPSPANRGDIQRFAGRFDSDEEDPIPELAETSVTRLKKVFEDTNEVVKDSLLTASLLKYLYSHNTEYFSLLFYLVAQYYKTMSIAKDFSRDAAKFANEIYTTFLHEKSILKVEHVNNRESILQDLRQNKDIGNIFEKTSDNILNHCINENLNKLRQSVTHGLFDVDYPFGKKDHETKMNCLNDTIKYIVESLEKKQVQDPKTLNAIKCSLATIYHYFSKQDKEDNSDNISLSSKLFRSNFPSRSMENLQSISNFYLDKQPIFCNKYNKKGTSHSFFKKIKNVKGHNFHEKSFEYPMDCMYCSELLWGLNPQGVACSNCQEAAHKHCKEHVSKVCQKQDNKKFQKGHSTPNWFDSSKTSPEENQNSCATPTENIKEQPVFSDINSDYSNVSATVTTLSSIKDENLDSMSKSDTNNNCSIVNDGVSINNDNNMSHIAQTNIVISKSDDKISNDYENDINSLNAQKSENFKKSNVKNLINTYDQKMFRSQSEENLDYKSLPRAQKRESVQVHDLIQDSDVWSNDPDMNVEETFEADKELKAFPKHVTSTTDKAEYIRLLVLMEFYHKIRFTVMTLKRFDYLLIKRWPDEKYLFKTLSLHCIIPLYELIKKLAQTIEACKTEFTFSNEMANNVYNWLVENEEQNFQEWLLYSINICCTNSLFVVKNQWKESKKTDNRLSSVLDIRYNKMVVVEQLSNMRPLLFNLPLIINKVIRDLSKYSKFKDEAKIWRDIHEKFKLLPTYIDEKCMPLVELINNNTIVNGLDRMSWISKVNSREPWHDYMADFPKTAFQYKVFDFQELKISNFRESANKNKTPAVFVKELSDAYAICYDKMLVLLQKENDKFLLKQFKGSEMSRCNPILTLDSVHVSKGLGKDNKFEMTLVFISVAVLTQIIFKTKKALEKWFDFICRSKTYSLKNRSPSTVSSGYENVSVSNKPETIYEKEYSEYDNIMDLMTKYEKPMTDFESDINSFYGEDLYVTPKSRSQCSVGIIKDSISILKTTSNFIEADDVNEEMEKYLPIIERLKVRIDNYKEHLLNCAKSQDYIKADDIDDQLAIESDVDLSSIHINTDQEEQTFKKDENVEVPLNEDSENSNSEVDDFVTGFIDDVICAAQKEILQQSDPEIS